MREKIILRSRNRAWSELVSWQFAAVGLLVLAVAVNMGLTARITALEEAQAESAAKLQQAEKVKTLAVEELGELSDRWVREQQARAEQAAAYEAVGAYRYVGECTITYYCPCEQCCGKWADGITASGLPATPGVVAVDPEVIPLGSTVVIDGQMYLAADTGVTGNHIDVCVVDHAAAEELGVGSADVWMVAG